MTPWYGPSALAQTGFRDFTSRVIGQYADQRILQAAVDWPENAELVARYDFTRADKLLPIDPAGGIWVDYVADTGDGFAPTAAVARLLTAPSLEIDANDEKLSLPAGEILLMGGDQAYPYASDAQYRNNLVTPFDICTWHAPEVRGRRKLFVLPGNHDWYDGLSAFDRLFCNRRDGISEGAVIGAYQCQQHRSYWAIKLPHDWWIWGLDIQLTASLDVGQMQYFSAIADTLPHDKSQAKIILCIATPSWLEGAESGTIGSYSENLQRILNLAIDRARVVCVIAGDWHHYARYFNDRHRLNLITSGGGGAYLAPTHLLPSTIEVPWKMATDAAIQRLTFKLNASPSTETAVVENTKHAPRPEAVFPPKAVSRAMTNGIPAFPFRNLTFCVALGFLYFLMYWFYTSAEVTPLAAHKDILQGTARRRIELDFLLTKDKGVLWPWQHLYYLFEVSRWQPFMAFTVMIVFGLIYQFFVHARGAWTRLGVAIVFWLVHVMLMAYLADGLLSYTAEHRSDFSTGWSRIAFTTTIMWILGGLLAGALCGLYLYIASRWSEGHADAGFSSMRITGYKNFLRMRITKDELIIYPIGLKKVPKRSKWRRPTDKEKADGEIAGYMPGKPLKPALIEGPIIIRPRDIVDMQPEKPASPALVMADIATDGQTAV